MLRWMADTLWAIGFRDAAALLHDAARSREEPVAYRLLCTECAPGTDWYSTYAGPCDGCGRYRNLMALKRIK